MPKAAKQRHFTEDEMLKLLKRRFTENRGNGPAWAFVPKVRDAAGFDARRTVDAIAMSLWPSRGLELHGFEIKCSRGDWIRELVNPAKAETWCQLVDRWWLVVSDESFVLDGELPETWGLMAVRGEKIFTLKNAPLLPALAASGEKPFNAKGRTLLAALMRAAIREGDVLPEEIQAAVDAERERSREQRDSLSARYEESLSELKGVIDDFQEALGVRIGRDQFRYGYEHDPKEVGAALRAILEGDKAHERLMNRYATLADNAERLAAEARRFVNDDRPIVTVAYCPEHGLQDDHDGCAVCGGRVTKIPMVPLQTLPPR